MTNCKAYMSHCNICIYIYIYILLSHTHTHTHTHTNTHTHIHTDGVEDMRGLLMEVVQNSSHGWDYVLEGIVQFGFSLMEGYSPRSVTSAVPFADLGCIDQIGV